MLCGKRTCTQMYYKYVGAIVISPDVVNSSRFGNRMLISGAYTALIVTCRRSQHEFSTDIAT